MSPVEKKEKHRAYREANRDLIRARSRAHYAANREKLAAYRKQNRTRLREQARKYKYGVGSEWLETQKTLQGGLCAVCGSAPALLVDHDHASGKVRSLLCHACNLGLGHFKDSPARLRAAAGYLEVFSLREHAQQLGGFE